MIIEHLGKRPVIAPDAYVAPSATVCGEVHVAAGARILHGACLVAEGGRIDIGDRVIVLQNAVVRSTARWSTSIGSHCLIGPNAHVAGCVIEDNVFVATGAAVFHGARLGEGSEVRIHGVVHIRTMLPAGTTVPIGWVAVGDPAQLFPPEAHDDIWAVQRTLRFAESVYGVEAGEASIMPEVTRHLSDVYGGHRDDVIIGDGTSPTWPP